MTKRWEVYEFAAGKWYFVRSFDNYPDAEDFAARLQLSKIKAA